MAKKYKYRKKKGFLSTIILILIVALLLGFTSKLDFDLDVLNELNKEDESSLIVGTYKKSYSISEENPFSDWYIECTLGTENVFNGEIKLTESNYLCDGGINVDLIIRDVMKYAYSYDENNNTLLSIRLSTSTNPTNSTNFVVQGINMISYEDFDYPGYYKDKEIKEIYSDTSVELLDSNLNEIYLYIGNIHEVRLNCENAKIIISSDFSYNNMHVEIINKGKMVENLTINLFNDTYIIDNYNEFGFYDLTNIISNYLDDLTLEEWLSNSGNTIRIQIENTLLDCISNSISIDNIGIFIFDIPLINNEMIEFVEIPV